MVQRIVGDRYQLRDEIGSGSVGTVYYAIDSETQQPVAVKLLRPEIIANDPNTLKRFKREAEILYQLQHPNIVRVLDTFEENSKHYLVMEYVGNGSLDDIIEAESPLPIDRVLTISIELADALTRAHHLKVIHRDIKPSNVLIANDGTPRLTDFGVAYIQTPQETTTTQENALIGTFSYLPPEVLNGEPVDGRSDIWAFGVTLYEMLTGQLPFTGNTVAQILLSITTMPPPDLEALRQDIPVGLVDLIYRMLEKDRNARIPSMRLIGAELESVIQGTSSKTIARLPSSPINISGGFVLASQPKHNLPAQTAAFIGREHELAELNMLLEQPETRLITILGPGGMGKTRLALEAAHRQIENFDDGVFFVPLASLHSAEGVITAVADAIDYKIPSDGYDPKLHLMDYLLDKQVLLILDNFEHLIDSSPLIHEMLEAAPRLQIVTTSRERLNMSGETIFNLAGMDFPETLEEALDSSAVQLFTQRARRVRPDFQVQNEDLPYIVSICRLVQGMPLGILLAAAWLEVISLSEIADEINRSFDFLTTEMRDVPERQRSIRAVFLHSWGMLKETERAVFARLSIFRSGFTRSAAQAVANASLRDLTGLANKSLLSRTPEGRYEIHDLLRQYAREQLELLGESQAVRQAHSHYFANFLHEREADLKGRRQLPALDEIEAEFENIVLAVDWAVSHQRHEIVHQMVESLYWFGFIRRETKEILLRALEQLAPKSGETPHAVYGRLLARTWPYVPDPRQNVEEALAIARQYDDILGIAISLQTLGWLTYDRDHNYAGAIYLYEQSLEYYQQLDNHFAMADVYTNLGLCRTRLEQLSEAILFYRKGLELSREVGDRVRTAAALSLLAENALLKGLYTVAELSYQEATLLTREMVTIWGIVWNTAQLGVMALLRGDLARAQKIADECMLLVKNMPYMRDKVPALVLMGLVRVIGEDYVGAELFFTQEKATESAYGFIPVIISELAQAMWTCGAGNFELAWERTLAILHNTHRSPMIKSWCLLIAALVQAHQGNKKQAVTFFSLSFHHSASPKGIIEKWPLLSRLRTNLETDLGLDEFADAWEHGKTLDLESTVRLLLAESHKARSSDSTSASIPDHVLAVNDSLVNPLSERELEVLTLLAAGLSNREIAERLIVAESTIKKHITHIYDKIGVTSRTQVIVRAQELHLV
jgi:predicted ATPase/DNA-binding CsgD family transcriptional regulator